MLIESLTVIRKSATLAKVAEIDSRLALVGGDEAFAKIKADFDIVSSFICSINEDHLEEMFNDHVRVRCNRDGIEVFEYTDHG